MYKTIQLLSRTEVTNVTTKFASSKGFIEEVHISQRHI